MPKTLKLYAQCGFTSVCTTKLPEVVEVIKVNLAKIGVHIELQQRRYRESVASKCKYSERYKVQTFEISLQDEMFDAILKKIKVKFGNQSSHVSDSKIGLYLSGYMMGSTPLVTLVRNDRKSSDDSKGNL